MVRRLLVFLLFIQIFSPAFSLSPEKTFSLSHLDDPFFLEKKISLLLYDVDISDAINLVGKCVDTTFLIDPDVRGTVRSANFSDVPLSIVLRSLMHGNDPQLSLIKENGLFRVVRLSKAKEIVENLNEKGYESCVSTICYSRLGDSEKEKIGKMWEGIIDDQDDTKGCYLVFDDENQKVFFRGLSNHTLQFKRFLREIDLKIPQVKIEARFVCAERGFEENFGLEWSGIYNRRASSGRGVNLSLIDWALNFLPTPDLAAKVMSLPFVLGGGDVGNRRLNLMLNAAEDRNEIKTILKPSILTNDKERAKILVGETVPIETVVEESVDGRLRQRRTADYKDVGMKLHVLPVVSPDRRFVDLEIFIENSQKSDTVTSGSATYPVIRTTRSRSSVRLQSGQTTMISGLIKDVKEEYSRRVPILSDVPIIGWLFGGRRKRLQDMQLLIFITPTVA